MSVSIGIHTRRKPIRKAKKSLDSDDLRINLEFNHDGPISGSPRSISSYRWSAMVSGSGGYSPLGHLTVQILVLFILSILTTWKAHSRYRSATSISTECQDPR